MDRILSSFKILHTEIKQNKNIKKKNRIHSFKIIMTTTNFRKGNIARTYISLYSCFLYNCTAYM